MRAFRGRSRADATPARDAMTTQIPQSHTDLLTRPIIVALATEMPDGAPQVQPVWADLHDGHVRINTVVGRRKHLNLVERPHATVLLVDPDDDMRWLEIRCRVAAMSEEDGPEVIDILSRKYTGHDYTDHKPENTRITVLLEPTRIVTGG